MTFSGESLKPLVWRDEVAMTFKKDAQMRRPYIIEIRRPEKQNQTIRLTKDEVLFLLKGWKDD